MPVSIERALQTDGFMHETELTYLATLASRSNCIVEVGSYKGRSTTAFCVNCPGVVFAVDKWNTADHPEVLEQFRENTKGLTNLWPVHMDSYEASCLMQRAGIKADIVFIDGDHTFEECRKDILAWTPLLKPGAVLCGHDYAPEHPGVREAVDRMIPKFRLIGSIWTTEEEA
jgi:predicted O-methyltransferase YrrM